MVRYLWFYWSVTKCQYLSLFYIFGWDAIWCGPVGLKLGAFVQRGKCPRLAAPTIYFWSAGIFSFFVSVFLAYFPIFLNSSGILTVFDLSTLSSIITYSLFTYIRLAISFYSFCSQARLFISDFFLPRLSGAESYFFLHFLYAFRLVWHQAFFYFRNP